jgi:hypothetical protein
MSDLCQDKIDKNTGAAVRETTAIIKDSRKYKAVSMVYKAVSIQQNSI